jgi:HAD superfamily hydrolase (TIGR01490 family)
MTRAALFDMDRTLLSQETASLYVRYQRRIGEASARDLARTLAWVAQYTLGVLDHAAVARKVVRTLEGMPENQMAARCDEWFQKDVERFITDGGRVAVARHLAAGDTCAIVTGASLYASRPLASRLGIPHVVASVFEVDDRGFFTGRTEPPLCLGEGKLERALAFVKARGLGLEDAAFYTDSISDLPLLERVGEPVVVNPDPRLARVARRRGWPIERW